MGLSFHKIARYFEKHVGLKITPSGVYQLIERAARRTKTVSEAILERALMDAWLNMDETTWWQDGEKLWAWLMANLGLSYFHFDKSRGHKVIEELLCELDEDGNVIAPYEGTTMMDSMEWQTRIEKIKKKTVIAEIPRFNFDVVLGNLFLIF